MKKIISLLLAVILTTGLLASCAGNAKTPATSAPTQTPKATATEAPAKQEEPAEPVEEIVEIRKFSILNDCWAQAEVPADVDVNDNKWADIFKEYLPTIDIEWIIAQPGTMAERKSLLMGSGDFPDVVPMDMSEMIRWADQGILQPIEQ